VHLHPFDSIYPPLCCIACQVEIKSRPKVNATTLCEIRSSFGTKKIR
jgi:hypothetical protein